MQLPATVATLLVHTAVYTIYLHLHCASFYVLKRKRESHASNANTLPTITVSLILLILITTQWALTIADTFTFFEATRSWPLDAIINSSPMIYDGHHGEAKMALYIAQTVVGDGFFAYRLYLVYGKRWVVLIAPVFFILGFVACGILNIMWGSVTLLLYPMFVSTVIANVTITGMITFKVWKTNRAIAVSLGADPLGSSKSKSMALTWSVLYTLLESAGIYTLCVIATAVAPLFSGDSLSAFLSAIGPMIGIAFSLIIILVGLGKSTESSSDMPAPTLLIFRRSNRGDEAGGVYETSGERVEEYVGEVGEGSGGFTKRQSKPVPAGDSAELGV